MLIDDQNTSKLLSGELASTFGLDVDKLNKAKFEVDEKKADYGFGTSTKIIIYNKTKDDLEFFECGSTSGQWSVKWDEQKKAFFYQIPPDIVSCFFCCFYPILVTWFLVIFGDKVTKILRNSLFIFYFVLPV